MLPSLAPAWFYPTPTQCSRSGMGKNEVSFVISKFDICLTKCTQDGNHSVTQKKCLHSDCSYPDEIIQAKGALGRPSTLATEGQEGYQGENQKPWCLWWLSWQMCGKQCFLSHFSCLWLVTETTHTHTHRLKCSDLQEPQAQPFPSEILGPELCSSFEKTVVQLPQ